MARTATVLTVAGVTVLASVIGYAAYFDYKRRNDVAFRKKLRKEHKKVDRAAKQDDSVSKSTDSAATHDLKSALEGIKLEVVPESAEDREKYFMDNVAMGEALCARGPIFELPAALSFYRALRVYPAPVELIMIYQKTVPEPVFKVVMELTNLDVSGHDGAAKDMGIDEDAEGDAGSPSGRSANASSRSASRRGPPSETSSQEWDNLTDPGPTL